MQDLRLRGDETIAFGETLTEWRHVEGAADVISIIVDAREDCLKTLNQDQVIEAHELRIEDMITFEHESLLQQGRG
jgi:hypothetical protein